MKRSLMVLAVLLVGLMVVVGCVEEAAEPGESENDQEEMTFEILCRSKDEVVAYVHIDHWHGELPELAEGDNLSLGAYIVEDGEEVELDGEHYALCVDCVPGADETIVSFDLHGDHVHLIGEQEGSTEVVFQLFHDGHIDYETPPIKVEVGT